MFQLPSLKARVVRLEKLEKGLAAELAAWKDAEHPLTEMERQWRIGFLGQARAAVFAQPVAVAYPGLNVRPLLPAAADLAVLEGIKRPAGAEAKSNPRTSQ